MKSVRTDLDGGILRVTLARPEHRNAFDAGVIEQLHDAVRDAGDARVVWLSGEGPSFSAGADADWMRSSVSLSREENVADAERLRAMLTVLDECPAPTLATVQGHAMGGGAGLVACCDIVVAQPDAVFAFSETKLGLVPAVISPFVIAKIGASAARRLFVTGERFDAELALRIGLATELAGDLEAAATRVIHEILSGGPHATRVAKTIVRQRPSGIETSRLIAEVRSGREAQEGLQAFLEKRPADWRDDR
ncbi:MAG: enoyl-CoA hydratase-related protein [Gaiellales bacterium]